MPSGPSRASRSRTGADSSGPEPTSTACSASGALTGHRGLVVDAAGQPGDDLAQRVLGTTLSSGGTSSSWPWPVRGAGLEPRPLLLEPAHDPGRDRPVDPGQQQHPVGERPVGRELAEVERRAAPRPCPRRTGSRACAAARRRAPRAGLPEAVERLALAQERAAAQARVPADQRARTASTRRPGRPRGSRRAACRPRRRRARRGRGGTAGPPRCWRASSAPGRGRPAARRSHRCRRSRTAAPRSRPRRAPRPAGGRCGARRGPPPPSAGTGSAPPRARPPAGRETQP